MFLQIRYKGKEVSQTIREKIKERMLEGAKGRKRRGGREKGEGGRGEEVESAG